MAQTSSSRTFSQKCAGTEATGVAYGITGSSINVRKGPGTNHEKIVNQKATSTLGKTHYVQIDHIRRTRPDKNIDFVPTPL